MKQIAMLIALGIGLCSTARAEDIRNATYGYKLPASSPKAAVWWASSGWKVGRTKAVPKAASAAVLIRAARNEAEAAQIVIRPAAALKRFQPAGSPLKGPGGAMIPERNVEILRVRYVNVTRPTDKSASPGPWPDPLPPFQGPVDLAADKNQPLWVRVTVPPKTPASTYKGTVRLRAEGFSALVPLRVEVYDFDLPDRMTCTTAFGFSPPNVYRYHNLKEEKHKREVLAKYWASMGAHHISPYNPAPLDPIRVTWPDVKAAPKGAGPTDRQLQVKLDFTAWDKAMGRAIDQYHFNSFRLRIPGMGGGSFHAIAKPSLQGFAEDSSQYAAMFDSYCSQLQAHLAKRGWLDEAFVYWFDEPSPKQYAFVKGGFDKLKKSCPGIARMITEQVEEGLIGGPNIWCPVTPNYDHKKAEQRRRQGEKFWWYVCCGPKAPHAGLFIDHAGTELRVWLWQTFKRDISGILIWQTNYWTSNTAYPRPGKPQNPYEDPMGWVSGYSTPAGKRKPWGNGDGRFIYPPEAAAAADSKEPVLAGPVDSIRWEMLRDGIEDYEYLSMLRRLLDQRRDKPPGPLGGLPAEQHKTYRALLDVPKSITTNMTTFTRDPAPIEQRRHAVARAIEKLRR